MYVLVGWLASLFLFFQLSKYHCYRNYTFVKPGGHPCNGEMKDGCYIGQA
jgi:hypothetical protein